MDKKLLNLAFYLCTAVGGFFVFGGLAVGPTSYILLAVFNFIFLREEEEVIDFFH